MAAERNTADLERFIAERADHLLRTAVLLTGSREAGEDLLQTAVERLLRARGRNQVIRRRPGARWPCHARGSRPRPTSSS
jgi:DNA-directed RNA polymerase specialized sigma24 family protein